MKKECHSRAAVVYNKDTPKALTSETCSQFLLPDPALEWRTTMHSKREPWHAAITKHIVREVSLIQKDMIQTVQLWVELKPILNNPCGDAGCGIYLERVFRNVRKTCISAGNFISIISHWAFPPNVQANQSTVKCKSRVLCPQANINSK